MKKAIILVALIVVVAVVAFTLYRNFTQSPKYSLSKVQTAIKEHDITSFQKYVDVDGTVSRMVDQIMLAMEEDEPKSGAEGLGESIGKGLIELLKPQFSEIIRDKILQYVETGSVEADSSETGTPLDFASMVNPDDDQYEFKGIKYEKKDRKIAHIGLEFDLKEYSSSLVADLLMRDKGDYWQIAEITNLNKLIDEMNGFEEERIAELNKPIIDAMDKALDISNVKRIARNEEYEWNKSVYFTMDIENKSEKEIIEFSFLIKCFDNQGNKIFEMPCIDKDIFPSGKKDSGSWKKEINPFIDSDTKLYEATNIDIEIEVAEILFTDMTKLKLYNKWDKVR